MHSQRPVSKWSLRVVVTLALGAPQPALAANLVPDGSFDAPGDFGWAWVLDTSSGAEATAENAGGRLCVDVSAPGTEAPHVQILQFGWWESPGHIVDAGSPYRGRLTAWSEGTSDDVGLSVSLGQRDTPYAEAWPATVTSITPAAPALVEFEGTPDAVVGSADNPLILKIQLGAGPTTGYTLCIDDVDFDTPAQATTVPSGVFVNQVGYPIRGEKLALAQVSSSVSTPRSWSLYQDEAGALTEVLTGTSVPLETDEHSGVTLHQIDFSEHQQAGHYRVGVHHPDPEGEWLSFPFQVSDEVYAPLARDAMRFYYHQRCNQEFEQPFVEDDRWLRASGHAGDQNACVNDTNKSDATTLTESDCMRRLDVSQGWYDAGDYGKYLPNGGISVWTLLNSFERAQIRRTVDQLPIFAERALNIPDSTRLPDFLDEVLWELDFFERMQEPDGMVHHMVNGPDWSPWGYPADDAQQRWVFPVSTAATLNFAAVMAQASRVFAAIPDEAERAERYLESATLAWEAAVEHPDAFPPLMQLAYVDDELADEWLWAAAELYLATGEQAFGERLEGADLLAPLWWCSWKDTGCLATHSLATVTSSDNEFFFPARDAILEAASGLVSEMAENPFRLPLQLDAYVWGSNSIVANYGLTLGRAFDLAARDADAAGVFDVLSYLLGRNALAKSFVSGYGSNPLNNPHHRVYAYQHYSGAAIHLEHLFAHVPPGFLAGGPNAAIEDDYMSAAFPAGADFPALAYRDHVDSFSTNEVTINWNAPLLWLSVFADEWSRGIEGAAPPDPATTGGGAAGAAPSSEVSSGGSSSVGGASPEGGAGPDPSKDPAGCGCRVTAPSAGGEPSLWAAALLVLLVWRRRDAMAPG